MDEKIDKKKLKKQNQRWSLNILERRLSFYKNSSLSELQKHFFKFFKGDQSSAEKMQLAYINAVWAKEIDTLRIQAQIIFLKEKLV